MQHDDNSRYKFYSEDVTVLDLYRKYIHPSKKYPNLVIHENEMLEMNIKRKTTIEKQKQKRNKETTGILVWKHLSVWAIIFKSEVH